MKRFNTTAVCIPSKHYMVDLTERVKEISKLVEAGITFSWHFQYPLFSAACVSRNVLVEKLLI